MVGYFCIIPLDKSFFFQLVTYSSAPYYTLVTYMTSVPQPIDPFLNIVYPFTSLLWGTVVLVVFVVSAAAWMLHDVYTSLGKKYPHEIA